MHLDDTNLFRNEMSLRGAGQSEGRSWRPLGTAPTDGRDVMVWVRWKNASPSATVAYADRKHWRRAANGRPIAPEAIVGWQPLLPAGE
jgi:hypothetical protein